MPEKKLRLERQAQELQCTIIKLREALEKSLINKKSAIDSLQQTHDLNIREFEKNHPITANAKPKRTTE